MNVYEVTVSWEVVSKIKVKASSEDEALATAQYHCPVEYGFAPYWSQPESVGGSESYWDEIKVLDDPENYNVKAKKTLRAQN